MAVKSKPVVVHGIPNCDTMKKARRWLDANGVDYRFHDYRKDGVDAALLNGFIEAIEQGAAHGAATGDGWELLVNRRGTTWRKLDEDKRGTLDSDAAVALMIDQPALIKRPVLVRGNQLLVGFDEARYREVLTASRR